MNHQNPKQPQARNRKKMMRKSPRKWQKRPKNAWEECRYGIFDKTARSSEKGESKAIVTVLGKDVPVSSTKSFTGHLLGAAGAVEAVATIEALRHNYIPMTAGTCELSEDIEANVVYGQGQEAELEYAISNTFGFGGHNAVLALKRWEA